MRKKNWFTDVVRTSIEILSSLPSVVVGLLVFSLRYPIRLRILDYFRSPSTNFFNLPLLTRNVEESLQAIHYTQREAGLSLDCTLGNSHANHRS